MKKLSFAFILSIEAIYFIFCSLNRVIARDEGFYLYAMQLINQGKVPYLDFFYPQTPYLPYIYNFFLLPFELSWINTRVLSAIFAAGGIFLLFICLSKKSFKLALYFCLLFSICNFIFPWFAITKTYVLSFLLISIAYVLITDFDQRKISSSSYSYFFTGLILSIATGVRLMLLPIHAIFFIWIIFHRSSKKNTSLFILGSLLGLLPMIYFAIQDWQVFLYNNWGYHQTRWLVSEQKSTQHFYHILFALLGVNPIKSVGAIHFPIIIWLFTFVFAFNLILKKQISLLSLSAISLFYVSLIPKPSYLQYFCLPAAFMLYEIIKFYAVNNEDKKYFYIKNISLSLILIFFLINIKDDFNKYLGTAGGIVGVRTPEEAKLWSLDNLNKIINQLQTYPQSPVFCSWPGYLVNTNLSAIPSNENHFAQQAARKMSSERQSKYKVANNKTFAKKISESRPNYLILLNKELNDKNISPVIHQFYEKTDELPPLSIFTLKK